MPAATWHDWALWTLGALVAAAGLAVALRALFHDRFRGRRRCPKCWYDMAGVPGLTCPECGRAARSECSLARTRRHKRTAAAGAIALALGLAAAATPAVRRHGILALAPTTLLVCIIPEVERVPVDDSWTYWWHDATSKELHRRIEQGRLRSWHWRLALRRSGAIRGRDRWVAGEMYWVSIERPGWAWPYEIRVAGGPPLPREEVGWDSFGGPIHAFAAAPVAVVPAGEHPVRFDVEVYGSKGVVWRGGWSITVEGVDSVDEILPPNSAVPETPLLIADDLRGPNIATHDRPGPPTARAHVQPGSTGGRLVISLAAGGMFRRPETAYAGEFELRSDGAAAAARGIFHIVSGTDAYSRQLGSFTIDDPFIPTLIRDPAERAKWTLTIRGGGPPVLRHLLATSYWDGELVIPLTTLWPAPPPAPGAANGPAAGAAGPDPDAQDAPPPSDLTPP